jgi:hypothetical protein
MRNRIGPTYDTFVCVTASYYVNRLLATPFCCRLTFHPNAGSDVVLEDRPWPRGQKITSLALALRVLALALVLVLRLWP